MKRLLTSLEIQHKKNLCNSETRKDFYNHLGNILNIIKVGYSSNLRIKMWNKTLNLVDKLRIEKDLKVWQRIMLF